MKIRMLTIVAGPDMNAKPGQIVNVAKEVGADMIQNGFAEFVDKPKARTKPSETTEATPQVEAAVSMPVMRKRRGGV